MGLDITVAGKHYYGHSYHCIHDLRFFAAKIEYPDLTNADAPDPNSHDDMYKKDFFRFSTLIDHSDAEFGYIPLGKRVPKGRDFDDNNAKAWRWPTSEELFAELLDLGQYKEQMDEHVKQMYEEILSAARASVRLRKPILFL